MFLRMLTRHCLIAWILCFLAILMHAASLHELSVVAADFVLFPVLAGVAVGLFQYKATDEDPDMVDQELQVLDGSGVKYLFEGLLVAPVIVSLFVMILSQVQGAYDAAGWWVVVLGLLIGGEAGRYSRYRKMKQ